MEDEPPKVRKTYLCNRCVGTVEPEHEAAQRQYQIAELVPKPREKQPKTDNVELPADWSNT